jgi:hypothetical protein
MIQNEINKIINAVKPGDRYVYHLLKYAFIHAMYLFVCFLWFTQYRAIVSLNIISRLGFVVEMNFFPLWITNWIFILLLLF